LLYILVHIGATWSFHFKTNERITIKMNMKFPFQNQRENNNKNEYEVSISEPTRKKQQYLYKKSQDKLTGYSPLNNTTLYPFSLHWNLPDRPRHDIFPSCPNSNPNKYILCLQHIQYKRCNSRNTLPIPIPNTRDTIPSTIPL
jgi:hypothetical protein